MVLSNNKVVSSYNNGYSDGYNNALHDLFRRIVNNSDLPLRTNPHYLDGRIDKQILILDMIKEKLAETEV